MSLTAIVFFVLKWLELLVLYFSGKALETTKTRKDYWKIAIAPILAFALVEGLRWGRLIDWNNAVVEYTELNGYFSDRHHSNPLYTIIIYSLKCLGLPYPFFVVIQCGFLFFSALFLLQDYKKYLRWVLPCLLMAFVNNENFIRFYFALSFLFISIYFYFQSSYIKYILFSLLTALIHFGLLPVMLLLSLIKFLNYRRINRSIGIVLYLSALFLADISQMEFLVSLSDYIFSIFGSESDYTLFSRLSSMNDIINGAAYGTEERLFVQKLSTKIVNAMLYAPLIWMAPSCLKKDKWGILVYNLTVINLIMTPIFGQAELLQRFPMSFNIFVVISFSAVIVNNINRKHTAILIYMMLFFYFYAFLNAPFVREDGMMYFLWDSHGAATNYAPYLH